MDKEFLSFQAEGDLKGDLEKVASATMLSRSDVIRRLLRFALSQYRSNPQELGAQLLSSPILSQPQEVPQC